MKMRPFDVYPLCMDWNRMRIRIYVREIIDSWDDYDESISRMGKAYRYLCKKRRLEGLW